MPSPTSPVRAASVIALTVGLDEAVADADLEAHLLGQRHLDRRAAVVLDVLGLAAVSLHAADGEPAHLHAEERLEHRVDLLGSDDGDDHLHARPPSVDTAGAAMTLGTSSGPMRMAPSPSA